MYALDLLQLCPTTVSSEHVSMCAARTATKSTMCPLEALTRTGNSQQGRVWHCSEAFATML